MATDKLGCTLFAISAIILALSTFNLINKKKEAFTEVEDRMYGGNALDNTLKLEQYQDSVIVNNGTSVEQVNKQGAQYYLNLQAYLSPTLQNLELASNISARPIQAGIPLPGAAQSYSNQNGNGYVNNLGNLGGGEFATVAYSNERASQLSKCAKDLPMFASSSLLPKPSSNADNNALSQSAARSLAAWTNLSPVEQLGAITSTNLPFGKTTDFRAAIEIPRNNIQTAMFNSSPGLGIPAFFGSINSETGRPGFNYGGFGGEDARQQQSAMNRR